MIPRGQASTEAKRAVLELIPPRARGPPFLVATARADLSRAPKLLSTHRGLPARTGKASGRWLALCTIAEALSESRSNEALASSGVGVRATGAVSGSTAAHRVSWPIFQIEVVETLQHGKNPGQALDQAQRQTVRHPPYPARRSRSEDRPYAAPARRREERTREAQSTALWQGDRECAGIVSGTPSAAKAALLVAFRPTRV